MFRVLALAVLVSIVLAGSAAAQQERPAEPVRPSAQQDRPRGPASGSGAGRLGSQQFDLIRQYLKFSGEQSVTFNGLVETYKARVLEEATGMLANIDQMRMLAEDLKKAEAAGETEKAAQMRRELDELRPETRPAREFYAALEEMLNPEQKKLLPQLKLMISGAPAASGKPLRPREVARLAESLGLSAEQDAQLRKLQDAFRGKIEQVGRTEAGAPMLLTAQLIADVRAILTPEQAVRFDKAIAARTGPASQPASAPARAPARAPASAPARAPASAPAPATP